MNLELVETYTWEHVYKFISEMHDELEDAGAIVTLTREVVDEARRRGFLKPHIKVGVYDDDDWSYVQILWDLPNVPEQDHGSTATIWIHPCLGMSFKAVRWEPALFFVTVYGEESGCVRHHTPQQGGVPDEFWGILGVMTQLWRTCEQSLAP